MKEITLEHWVKYEDIIPDTKDRHLALSLLGTKLQGIYEELVTWPAPLVAEAYIYYSGVPDHKFNEFYVMNYLNLNYETSFIKFLQNLLE